MDEYFCPNCGAILNEQYGFDPDKGTWTCTECGQHLMDDDVYEGVRFEGVAWYCDECNALLNRQSGFSDIYDSWTCTECGHINGITEDNIVINDTDRKNIVTCPCCGDSLNDQLCYSDYADDWTCVSCGARLHREYSYGEYEVCCEEESFGCEENDDIEYCAKSVCLENEMRDNNIKQNAKTPQKKDSQFVSNRNKEKQDDFVRPKVKSKRRKVPWGIILVIIGLLLARRLYLLDEEKKTILVQYSSSELKGQDYEVVEDKLFAAGFENIRTTTISDLSYKERDLEGTVESVLIGNVNCFEADTKFKRYEEVLISYHVVKKIFLPVSSKEIKNKKFGEVAQQFESAGFVNIKTEPIFDIITGWLTKDGEIEEILIDGVPLSDASGAYYADVQIIVKYHTYKKNAE